MVREEEFKNWLGQGGATPASQVTRSYAVRTIEGRLAALGSPYTDLDSAWRGDEFKQLRQRLKDIRDDFRRGGTDFKQLMPQSDQPLNRLSNWRAWLVQYGQFLSGKPRGSHDADRIRQ